MTVKRSVLALLFVLLAFPVAAGAAERDFVVVVHVDNPTESLSRQEIARMFLKQRARWDHGARVRPVDLSESWEVRDDFSLAVFRRRTIDIESHWKTMVFSGRDVPPPEKGSEAEVLEYVASHPGAIGYVSRATPLIPGVQTLDVIE